MRTCAACGFENAEEGKPCSLCGSSTAAAPEEAPTAQFTETRVRAGEGGGPAPRAPGSALGGVIAGRYRVDALLGAGGMGEVYRVHDLSEGGDRALKVLHAAEREDPDRTSRFKREIGVLSRIDHPAVPRILDSGLADGGLFFVSELVEGKDLRQLSQGRGPWPVAEAVALVATVAEVLAAAHEIGIVHRDVKPSNVMIAADGSVKLLDFGLARGVGLDMATLTRTGTIVGTPGYMSPEQLDGRFVDERADVYSLGVVLFELLTARPVFSAPTPMALAVKHIMEPPPSPRSLRPELPMWLEKLALRCLEKDPARRYARAKELAAALRAGRAEARLRMQRLETGDSVLEDEDQASEWALVLASREEKTGWGTGMALRFRDRYYRLDLIESTREGAGRFVYRFAPWPPEVVFRRLVDYEQDCRERQAERERRLGSRLQKWISGKGE